MAIPTNIKTLLSGEVVEWARIEFKETWDAAASLKTICAFANDLDNWGGGYIVIGVEEEEGRPVYPLKGVPVEKLDKYQKEIFKKCKLIRPAYMPIIGKETYQDKHFIVVWCPGGETRPYSSPKTMANDNKERIHYIRKASNTVEPTDDNIIEKTFKGPIQQQLRDALQYIHNVVITEKVIKHPDRAEADRFFNFPYAAIEEALSNAVYHRAYDEREPIEVRVESDRIASDRG
jgi:predicted HTH transcriptional regulator